MAAMGEQDSEALMYKRLTLLALIIASATLTSQAAVTVERAAIKVEHRTFDPAHPPKQMPSLGPHESAVTESYFNCTTASEYRTSTGGNDRRTHVKITSIQVDLELRVTIWLPLNAPQKLKAHEEGHRQIAQRIYERDAQQTAKVAADAIDGLELNLKDDDPAAVKAAITEKTGTIATAFLKATAERAQRIGERYDQLTDHGRRESPDEAHAIEQAFADEAAQANERAASQPSARLNANATQPSRDKRRAR